MASVHKLLGAQNMAGMSSSVHVVENIHLQEDQSERTQPCVHGTCYAFPFPVSSPCMWKNLCVQVLVLYLDSKLIAGVASIHLRAGQVKLPFIEGSTVVDVVGDLAEDLLVNRNALHT